MPVRESATVAPVKRVRVTAFDCACARCGHKWRALVKPERCPSCKARHWERPALWRKPTRRRTSK